MQCSKWLAIISIVLFMGCEKQPEPQKTESQEPVVKPLASSAEIVDAGKQVAQKNCSTCHGVQGATSKNDAPFIGGQQVTYMIAALKAFKEGVRHDNEPHKGLENLTETDINNAAAYYAVQKVQWNPQPYVKKPVVKTVGQKAVENGRKRSASCVDCHGKDGNSTISGIPTLAGLQADYIETALNDYFKGKRAETKIIMQYFKHSVNKKDIHDLAAFFSTRKALLSPLPVKGSSKKGEAEATQKCAGCHGIDGNSISPTMPSLTGQNQEYLIKAIKAYRDGKRKNSMMRAAVKGLKDRSIRNISAYYAKQQPKKAVGTDSASGPFDPIGDGEKIAASCNGCHGKNGNSTNSGTPSLSRLHPKYMATAIKTYQDGTRKHETMQSLVSLLSEMDIEKVGLYYATQEPTASANPKAGKPQQAEDLASSCNGCHGENGNSTDPEVPAIAGQDAKYLVTAMANYASGARENETMANAVKELSKEQMRDVAAYYATQAPIKLEGITLPLPPQDLAEKCNRCHGDNNSSEDPSIPRITGQIQAYLEKALNDYRNGSRVSSTMHAMSDVLSLSELKAIAGYYANK